MTMINQRVQKEIKHLKSGDKRSAESPACSKSDVEDNSLVDPLPAAAPFTSVYASIVIEQKFAPQHTSGGLMADVTYLEYPWDGY